MIGLTMEDPMEPIRVILKVKERWEKQKDVVQDAKYIEELILKDLVKTIKSYELPYDYINDIINKAFQQQHEKYKKDRKDFHNIESMIRRDFLNDDKRFKLKAIVSGGYESYYWNFEFTCQANEGEAIPDFIISIPIKRKLDESNISVASWGQLEFLVREKWCVTSVKHKCYDIESMSKYIQEYFNLESNS